jgi:hypothetical protein
MKVIESFWVGRLGFVKANNGFETKIYAGLTTADTQPLAEAEVVKQGYEIPQIHLLNFLQVDNFNQEYQQQEQ